MLPLSGSSNAKCACCHEGDVRQPARHSASRKGRDVVAGALSVGLWVLTPKCPACLTAHVALWTGLGLSFATAKYLRWSLLLASGALLLYVVARRALSQRQWRSPRPEARRGKHPGEFGHSGFVLPSSFSSAKFSCRPTIDLTMGCRRVFLGGACVRAPLGAERSTVKPDCLLFRGDARSVLE